METEALNFLWEPSHHGFPKYNLPYQSYHLRWYQGILYLQLLIYSIESSELYLTQIYTPCLKKMLGFANIANTPKLPHHIGIFHLSGISTFNLISVLTSMDSTSHYIGHVL